MENPQLTDVVVASSPLVAEIETLSPRALTRAAHKAVENITQSSYRLGAVLSLIKQRIDGEKNKNFGYETFADFVDTELKVKVAQANNFVYVYRALQKKGISYEKVGKVSFSVLRAAVDALTVENVDTLVPQLETSTYKQAVTNFKATKDQHKAHAGAVSVKTKKAKAAPAPAAAGAAAADDVQDVQHTDTPASVPSVEQYAQTLTVEQLAAILKAVPRALLVDALNVSKALGYKLAPLTAKASAAKTHTQTKAAQAAV